MEDFLTEVDEEFFPSAVDYYQFSNNTIITNTDIIDNVQTYYGDHEEFPNNNHIVGKVVYPEYGTKGTIKYYLVKEIIACI